MRRSVIIAVLCAALSMLIGAGIRSSFGLFLVPIEEQMGTGRETFSLAMAINNIIFGLPLAGLLADRFARSKTIEFEFFCPRQSEAFFQISTSCQRLLCSQSVL